MRNCPSLPNHLVRRAFFVVIGLVAAACSGSGPPPESPAGTDDGEVVEVQTEPDGAAAVPGGEATGGLEADRESDDRHVVTTTILAEAMTLDELNVGYLVEWPIPTRAVLVGGVHDTALDLTVNWIPFASSHDMAQALQANDIDISHGHELRSFAASVTGGADLVLVGAAAARTGTEADGLGQRVFGVVATTGAFASDYPEAVAGFLQANDNAYRAYSYDRRPFIDDIASATGASRAATVALVDTFTFPTKEVQLSAAWLGGAVQQAMKEQMDSLVAAGELEAALGSYDAFVDTSFLETVG